MREYSRPNADGVEGCYLKTIPRTDLPPIMQDMSPFDIQFRVKFDYPHFYRINSCLLGDLRLLGLGVDFDDTGEVSNVTYFNESERENKIHAQLEGVFTVPYALKRMSRRQNIEYHE
jgi:hypothetical protein